MRRIAKAEKKAEEAQAKKAEEDSIAAREKQEKEEEQARLDRLIPLPNSEDDHYHPPTVEDEDTAGDISNDDASSQDHVQTPMSSQSDDTEDYHFVEDGGYDSADDEIEPDFIADDDEVVDLTGDVDDVIAGQIRSEPKSRNASPELDTPSLPSQESEPALTPDKDTESPPSEPGEPSGAPEEEAGQATNWASHMQLMTFRENATKIADDYLKDHGVKLRTGRQRSHVIRDRQAYDKGVEDGKTIDVHKKRIKEEEMSDGEGGASTGE